MAGSTVLVAFPYSRVPYTKRTTRKGLELCRYTENKKNKIRRLHSLNYPSVYVSRSDLCVYISLSEIPWPWVVVTLKWVSIMFLVRRVKFWNICFVIV